MSNKKVDRSLGTRIPSLVTAPSDMRAVFYFYNGDWISPNLRLFKIYTRNVHTECGDTVTMSLNMKNCINRTPRCS